MATISPARSRPHRQFSPSLPVSQVHRLRGAATPSDVRQIRAALGRNHAEIAAARTRLDRGRGRLLRPFPLRASSSTPSGRHVAFAPPLWISEIFAISALSTAFPKSTQCSANVLALTQQKPRGGAGGSLVAQGSPENFSGLLGGAGDFGKGGPAPPLQTTHRPGVQGGANQVFVFSIRIGANKDAPQLSGELPPAASRAEL